MKTHLIKIISAVSLLTTTSLFAVEAKPNLENNQDILTTIKQVSQKIGINDHKTYLKAVHTYINILSGREERQFKLLCELASFKEYSLLMQLKKQAPEDIKKSLLKEVNQQKADFANQLGIEVTLLDRFIKIYRQLGEQGYFEEIVIEGVYENAKAYNDAIKVNE